MEIVFILYLFFNFIHKTKESEIGDKIYQAALDMVGKYPYVTDGGDNYGATTGTIQEIHPYCNDTEISGFDCSGLTKYVVFNATKVSVIHKAKKQFNFLINYKKIVNFL